MGVFQCTICSVSQACIAKTLWMLSLKLLKFCSALTVGMQNQQLLTMFTPGHREHNINIEHTFSAFYCFKIVESGQTGRIRLFQFMQIALPNILPAKWFVKLKPRLLVLHHSNHRSDGSMSGNTFCSQCDDKPCIFLCELFKKYPPDTRDKWNCKYLEPVLTKKSVKQHAKF